MAKDDYEVIVCKILIYYYACLKRKTVFDEQALHHAIGVKDLNESYLTDILIMMQDDGLISGVKHVTAWGTESIITSGLNEIRITSAGIKLIKDNSVYERIFKPLIEKVDPIAVLIKMVL